MTETTDQKKTLQKQQTLEEAWLKGGWRRSWKTAVPLWRILFRFYKKGMELLKYCSSRLDTVEKKMLQMDEDGTLREF